LRRHLAPEVTLRDTRDSTPDAAAPGPRPGILLVDDNEDLRAILSRFLTKLGYEVHNVGTGEAGLAAMARDVFDVVLLDLELPGLGGLDVLRLGASLQADAQFIILTGWGSVGTAVEAMRLGAFDYIPKPPDLDELRLCITRALADRDLRREVARLRAHAAGEGMAQLIGDSPAMHRLRDEIARVAPTRANVLCNGETGTGKELVARAIHALSDRPGKAFVAINCSSLPESLLESELFGHLRGSFTGATANRRGLFEEAADGTLFLDEVGTLTLPVQVKLLRVLQERRIQRIGGGREVAVAFRLIAATNVDLAHEVAGGRFREDLYFRLNVVPIRVPPLRERGNDVLLLAAYFAARCADELGVVPAALSPTFVRQLQEHPWPGNVRQLENLMQRAVIMHAGSRMIPSMPVDQPVGSSPERDMVMHATDERWDLERLEREFILHVLQREHGQLARTADTLGIDRRTLYRKLKLYVEAGHLADAPAPEH
jgi:DNA-binding NtrC family response regulator